MPKVAVIQNSPFVLDRDKTIQLAVEEVKKASDEGAKLVIFPETFIPGYPAWIWRLRPGSDWETNETLHARLLDNSVDLSTTQLQPLYEAARTYNVTIVCGLHERDNSLSRTTLYNTAITISHEGRLINRHRKLMPTNPERMVWGFGDATGLKVLDTPCGRIGSLICWENFMPLARHALYSQGIDIYIAPTYDSGSNWLETMQHIAREGGCWVISAGVALHNRDIPEDFPQRDDLYPDQDEWINPGDSVVIAPGGEIIAGPVNKKKEILFADVNLDQVTAARRTFDVAGHYSRPDIFSLHVNAQPQSTIQFD